MSNITDFAYNLTDEAIDEYVSLAARISRRCAGDDRTVDTRPDPVVVATLMAGIQIENKIEGLWHQFESIWTVLSQLRDNQK